MSSQTGWSRHLSTEGGTIAEKVDIFGDFLVAIRLLLVNLSLLLFTTCSSGVVKEQREDLSDNKDE